MAQDAPTETETRQENKSCWIGFGGCGLYIRAMPGLRRPWSNLTRKLKLDEILLLEDPSFETLYIAEKIPHFLP